METPAHFIEGPPEWVVTKSGGGFEVRCTCGWTAPLIDTASLARAAGADHVAAQTASSAGTRRRRARRNP
jgi:hypothetical protein